MGPEMIDNVIPYIGGEEEKSEKEPLKLMGKIVGDEIVSADSRLSQLSAFVFLFQTVTSVQYL